MQPPPKLSLRPDRPRPHRVTFYEHGKRRTKHFATRQKAQAFANGIAREQREGSLALSTDERILFYRLRTVAEKKGIDLMARLKILLAQIEAAEVGTRNITLSDAIEEFITDCLARNLRPYSIRHYEKMLTYFSEGREKIPVHSIDGEMVLTWIRRRYQPADSQRAARAPLRRFLRWCQARGYRADVPEVDLQLPKADERRVEFLTPAEVANFFAILPPRFWTACALGFFAGIRPTELQRLEWSHINTATETIDIPGSVAKTRQFRRLHDLPPNLWAWIQATPDKKKGKIVPANYRKAVIKARRGAAWPRDAMRHTFATYGYHRGLEWCIDTMGHVSGYQMFVRHYKGAASKTAAEKYFAILPPSKSAEKILKERRPRPGKRHP